jgi:predicted porin
LLQKNGGGAKWAVTPGAMEQSKIGIKGKEQVMDDLDVVFKLEAGFNPVSGTIINAQKSQLDNQNNFTNLSNSTTNGSSSRSGQPFQGAAYGGLSSHTFGTITFGRQNGLMTDNVSTYDPQSNAYAFSPLGWTGFTAGGGNTEDARLDNSIKYNVSYGPARLGLMYHMNGTSNPYGGDDAYQADLGFDYANLSMDVTYALKHDAINTATTYGTLNVNQLAATVSDSRTWGVYLKYDWKPVKIMGGYEHITFTNPGTPLWSGATTLGGYQYGTLTQNKYSTNSVTHVVWTGAKWSVDPKLDLVAAYYMYIQDNFSGGDNGVCVAGGNKGTCAGTEKMISLSADYKMTKRFDAYAGIMYSRVDDGLYRGYLHTNTVSPAAGGRFKF